MLSLALETAVEQLRVTPGATLLREIARKDLDELKRLCGVVVIRIPELPAITQLQRQARRKVLSCEPNPAADAAALAAWVATGVEASLAVARWRRALSIIE